MPALPKPLVLIVDDNKNALEIAEEAFTDADCTVISVTEPEEAIRQLRASPGVNLVYTDVKLREKINDVSGIFLGDFVKAEQPTVPVAIYSIHFRSDELNERLHREADAKFDLVLPRGGSQDDEFEDQINRCVDLAKKNRDRRFTHRKHKKSGSKQAYSVVRELTIGSNEPTQAEEVLRDSGYSLRILSLDIKDGHFQSIPAWLLEYGGKYSAEVYGAPQFQATGASDTEALTRLAAKLKDAPRDKLSGTAGEEVISRLLLGLGTSPDEEQQ